jgi:hypothetical protein
MTMPMERTRSLRWMWEFLWELQFADNLISDERRKLYAILRCHPNGEEIKQWASVGEGLEPEDPAPAKQSEAPDSVNRPPVSPVDRAKAMNDAYLLLRMSDIKWSDEQRRVKQYVLRHYPGFDHGELLSLIRNAERLAREQPGYVPWVAKFA